MDLGRMLGAVLGGAALPPGRRPAAARRGSGPFGLTQAETRQIGRALGALATVAAEALARSPRPAPAPPPSPPPAGAAPGTPVPPVAPPRRLPETAPRPAPPAPLAEQAEARLILSAMIAAAKADGALDREERQAIAAQLDAAGLTGPERDAVLAEFDRPASVEDLARAARDPMLAAQLYAAAFVAMGEISPAERAWLDRLGAALRLDAAARSTMEARLGGERPCSP
ncbi:MAG: tellurite resistance TerB family protein [Roseococcus sp.]|nr:tellurite resistance TerB family protein [Roseococcus sp.]